MEIVNFYHYGSIENLEKSFDHWRYIGREAKNFNLPASLLANPYSVKKHGREAAIEKYKHFLWQKMKEDRVLKSILDLRKRTRLVCWCKPKSCHGDVIIAAWDWLQSQNPYDLYLYQLYDSMLQESDPYSCRRELEKKKRETYKKIKQTVCG